MKKDSTGASMKKRIRTRTLINLFIILVGLMGVISFMGYMQRRYSMAKTEQTFTAALDTITQTLDANTQRVEALRQQYHDDNRAVLTDIAMLLKSDRYLSLLTAANE